MDSRTRYVLPPVVAEGSPALADPSHSSITPGAVWESRGDYTDIRYEVSTGDDAGIAKITINRPHVRNAFRPQTLFELMHAFNEARDDSEVGVIILTGQGDWAFCSGGDVGVRGDDGYLGDDAVAQKGIGRLNVLDLQVQIRRTPKPVIAMVAGYAIGGGHVLHVVCDLTIAADNARFGQTGPKVGSFDGGYGSGLLARHIGQKRAREIWFLCRQYGAEQAYDWGLANAVRPARRRRDRDGPLGARRCSRSRRSRCACSRRRTTRPTTASPASSSSRATRRCSSTSPRRARRAATPTRSSRRPDFGKFPRRP